MAASEPCMVHFEGPELHCEEPLLAPGKKKIIANFHDECCFSGNDFKTHAYLLPSQQILQKKGKDRLIHVSGFINAKDGHLALRNEQDDIVEEAREIIYPGGNGGSWWDNKQLLKQQHDTIIPLSNPTIEHQGKLQKMTLPDGQPKGLQQVLKEHGFDVQNGMCTKCSPYWGWCKYCYRELDACPTDIIHQFINQSWHFMSAYRLGLTGKAAEWAV
ncbi:hypothetical protein HD554DRAFT_2204973 [Boletus coccyginus]|nr:hypothetical protein HD554DRAFT_2204973 [Boletus coccyginus]